MKTRELIKDFNVTIDYDERFNLFTISGSEAELEKDDNRGFMIMPKVAA